MKKTIVWMLGLILVTASAMAEEMKEHKGMPAPPKISAELEKIKSLAGRWEGVDSKDPNAKVSVEYQVTSGGSAVVEKLFPGTSKEMVSVYHDKNGKLAMTHYCMLGNQPQLEEKSFDGNKIGLSLSDASASELKGQMHMHALTVDFKDADHITETWGGYSADGKPMDATVIDVARVK